jgi:Tfp pilus assembly protein PilF
MAVAHLESATAREGSAQLKYHLAMAYFKAGDAKRGRLILESALKADPNLPEAKTAREMFGR